MTWQELIDAALQDLGVLASGESVSSDDNAIALSRLNTMVDSWNAEGLMAYQITTVSKAMNGAASYTVGSGGDINTTRPSKITFAYWRDTNNIDVTLTDLDPEEWHATTLKTLSGPPSYFYQDNGSPLIAVYLYPQPTDGTLFLGVRSQVAQVSTLTATIDMPPAYREALEYGLAARCAPAFRVSPPAGVLEIAASAKMKVKRNNTRPAAAGSDLVPAWHSNILTG